MEGQPAPRSPGPEALPRAGGFPAQVPAAIPWMSQPPPPAGPGPANPPAVPLTPARKAALFDLPTAGNAQFLPKPELLSGRRERATPAGDHFPFGPPSGVMARQDPVARPSVGAGAAPAAEPEPAGPSPALPSAARSDNQILAELAAVDVYFVSLERPEDAEPAAGAVRPPAPEAAEPEGPRPELLWLLTFLLAFVHSLRG